VRVHLEFPLKPKNIAPKNNPPNPIMTIYLRLINPRKAKSN